MRRRSSRGLAQRVILVVGLGVGLAVLGRYLVSLGHATSFGWYAYAPLNTSLSRGQFSDPVLQAQAGVKPWLRVLIWLALVGVWTTVSFFLLRPARKGIEADNPE